MWGRRWMVLGGLLASGLAHSEAVQPNESGSATFEMKFGSLTPDIDKGTNLGGKTPYATTFNGSMLFAQLEFDKVLWHRVGAVGLGVSVGYGEKYGPVRYASGTAAPQRTGLSVLPFKLLAVYRLDYGALHWGIPLIPYGKLGLIYEPWWTHKGGSVEMVDGERGEGARFGYGLTGGLSFLLDVIEPRIAKDAEVDLGIHHSYFFVEYTSDVVRRFKTGLDLSARYVMFGLAFDF